MANDFPFKLGLTSLTYPNLNLTENVKRCGETYDLIELTLEYPKSLPLTDEKISELNELKAEMGLEYSVHLPLSVQLASTNPHLRRASVEVIKETYRKAEALSPLVYTLHVTPIYYPGGSPLTHLFEIEQFEDQIDRAKESLVELNEVVDPGKIAVENLFTDLSRIQSFLEEEGYGRCLDVGHLVKRDEDPVLHYYENSDSIINLHLHGVVNGEDHQQLEPDAENFDLLGLFEAMEKRGYSGPVILEQFKLEHLNRSLETMKSAIQEVRVE